VVLRAALRDKPLVRFAFYAAFFGMGMLVWFLIAGYEAPLLWAIVAGLLFASLMATPRAIQEIASSCPPRSKTLTPTPEPARYCAGDVAGERGACAAHLRLA
jgi:hypothetical protein